MDDLRRPNGAVLVEPSVQSHSSSPDLTSSLRSATFLIEPEVWPQAERVTQEIITWVQPTVTSEEKRKEVIEYVQRLFRTRLGCEVYPFGSVPLKTYLPDGDIDLTAFCHFSSEESLAGEVSSMLAAEDTNPAAECIVKDVHTIRAEVRLVKCLVENIVVDISFNQIGGLCTLCFLEEVDRLIGKDHLFKRSIILIKAWCYYESRILGAHHGLISTYALETLVLYIFHLFHMSLNGPLSVLYKFLHYYSKFDWESYGVSLHGPVHISSLPEIVAEKPDNGGGDLLLKEDFLRKCVNMYSVPSRGAEISSKSHPKFLNIIDPLKENNNLGRSVSKGNFFRIRSAFAYGARKLGQILSQPQNNIGQEVQKFFTNSLERHRVHWYDSQNPLDITGPNGFAPEMSISSTCPSPSDASKDGSLTPSLGRINGDAKDQATSCLQISATKPDISKSSPSTSKESKPICAPHLFFSRPLDTEKMDNGDLDKAVVCSSSRKVWTSQTRGGDHNSSSELENRNSSKNHDFPASSGTKDVTTTAVTPDASCFDNLDCTPFRKRQSAGGGGPPETLMLLSHLSGDYDSQYSSLQYGRRWFEFASSVSVQAMHMPMQPPIFHHEVPWDAVQRPMHFRPMPYMNVNDVMMTRPAYPMSSTLFPMEEGAKSRGTGTYLPVMIHDSYRDRSSPRGKNPGPLRSPHNNGRGGYARGRDSHMRSSSAPGQYIFHQYGGMAPYEDWYYEAESSSPRGRTYKDSNGHVCTEKGVEIVSGGGSVPWEASSVTADKTSQPHPVAASVGQSSGNGGLNNTKGTEVVNPVCTASNAERLAGKSLRIKDEDFPPLSAR